ncbi:MAG: TRAP transporter substrate-binding protein [Roseitalea sp.]|jgi:TRAP-type C4-dicarboxylate transport system substrate-binding protein|uniref:C4-dicarboxylate ABC transporter n=1 Tax=Oceaniradius stylonematis TaxID=2184161 RepID=A0A3A8A590_9HYPH|nr:TRAP transporter substrate-binding protein [Oceaniradius stylonematis]MBO6552726.1 TRAP transporter substrate-binding protein [Roseitalea sp.]MBO6950353.1 TRAP transporter substrate-binding protein [Rhizobiaceae bacterium]RNC94786.1 MAG: C4-dicarboxylate ABC transporter [Oricola sp.]MBO6591658.1 TRAP transporter substrate-binding protein [Roseitalea sp.]MBO6599513.1 TRAP transporter substrate-binding protein [Roseitalea sp.]
MTTRRTLLGLAAGVTAAAMLAVSAPAALAQEVTLRLHQFLPAQANVPKLVLDVWADNVEEASEGRIKVERFPSMQLGGTPPELIDQAIDGIADVVWTVVGYTPGRFPSTEVFELPFMVSDARAASSAYWQMFEEHMKDGEFADVHILGTWVHGPGMIHSNKEVTSPDDMQGMRIRGATRQVNALLEQLGATPVGMPVPAVSEALSKGVIDGTTIPWEVTTALKVPELVDNHTEFEGAHLYNVTFVLAMNKDRYESLPDDLKAVIDANSGHDFSVFAGGTQSDADGPSRQIAVDLGNNIVTVSEDQVAVWRERSQPIYDAWVAEMSEKGIDGQALIDQARELMDAYDGGN